MVATFPVALGPAEQVSDQPVAVAGESDRHGEDLAPAIVLVRVPYEQAQVAVVQELTRRREFLERAMHEVHVSRARFAQHPRAQQQVRRYTTRFEVGPHRTREVAPDLLLGLLAPHFRVAVSDHPAREPLQDRLSGPITQHRALGRTTLHS